MAEANLEYIKSLADYAVDYAQTEELGLSDEQIADAVGSVISYTKSFESDPYIENAIAKANRDKELVKQALINYFTQIDEEEDAKFANQFTKSETGEPEYEIEKSATQASVDDVLTLHPIHILAHILDETGEGFEWSKCQADLIDPDFCPREVISEINRRHGLAYYPHTHVDDANSNTFYHKSAVNLLTSGFSEMHERVHKMDYSSFVKGDSHVNHIVESLRGGASLDYSGGQMDPALVSHILEKHGDSYDNHPMEVPLVKAEYAELTEAIQGAKWDAAYRQFAPYAGVFKSVASSVPRIMCEANVPIMKSIGAIVAVAKPLLSAAAKNPAIRAGAAELATTAATSGMKAVSDRLRKKNELGDAAVDSVSPGGVATQTVIKKSGAEDTTAEDTAVRMAELVQKAQAGNFTEADVTELQSLIQKAEEILPKPEVVEPTEVAVEPEETAMDTFQKAFAAQTIKSGDDRIYKGIYAVKDFDAIGNLMRVKYPNKIT